MKRFLVALVFAILAIAGTQVSAKAATIDLHDVTDTTHFGFGGAVGIGLPATVISDDIKFTLSAAGTVSGKIENFDVHFGPFTLFGISGFTATFLGNPLTLLPDGSFSIAGLVAAGDYLIHISGITSGFFGGAYYAEVTAATPIPGALLLFVTAIGGIAGFTRLRRRGSAEA